MSSTPTDFDRMGSMEITSGTTPIARSYLSSEPALIQVEQVLISTVTLLAAPNRIAYGSKPAAQPAVVASLERSLKQHAEIWAELSKY
jgi:hypothetical protein